MKQNTDYSSAIKHLDSRYFSLLDGLLLGEEITLTYFANPFVMETDRLETYYITALLGGSPIGINDQPYLLVGSEDLKTDMVDYGTFTIRAPEVSGKYTFVALLGVNPHHLRSRDNFFPIETSIPFIIEVVE